VCVLEVCTKQTFFMLLLLLSLSLLGLKLLNRLQTSGCVLLSRAGGDHLIPIPYDLLRLTGRTIAVLDW